MAEQTQERQIGDTRTAIAGICTRPSGTVVDLTSLTLKFAMYDSQGTVKVAETSSNVTVTDASAGEVEYAPQAADVDTEGTYNGYFIAEAGTGEQDTFPAVVGDFKIIINAVT
jgi:hypothetical protein